MLQTRIATALDYQAVENLLLEQHAYHANLVPESMTPIRQRLSKREFAVVIADSGQDFILALVDDEIVGLAWVVHRRLDGHGVKTMQVAFIQEICVVPSHRRAGFGSQLMTAIVHWGRQRELVRVEFNVWAPNKSALEFYQSLGFKFLRHEMVRRIDPAD